MENKPIYCGSGKEKFEGNLLEITLCLSDLPKEHITEYNGKKYIKLKAKKKKEVDKFGKTHSLEVDTWKPSAKAEPKVEAKVEPMQDDDSSLPF